MHFQQIDGLKYLTFDLLTDAGVRNAVFTRHGGVSQSPWAALNVGSTVGDDPQHVMRNKELTLQALHLPEQNIYDVWQVHGNDVVCAHAPRPSDQAHAKADAILTNQPGVSLMMRFADCVPVLLADPVRHVAGIVHAGWQGTVKRVVQTAVQVMTSQYGSRPRDVRAVIGPSIGPDHYVIGEDVIEHIKAGFGTDTQELLKLIPGKFSNGRANFDLWRANQLLLERAGVQHIQTAAICTACHVQDWYSHRQEQGKTGRFGVLVTLNSHHL
jgi:YfiH family protein